MHYVLFLRQTSLRRLVVSIRLNVHRIAVLLEINRIRRFEVVQIIVRNMPVGPALRHDRFDGFTNLCASVNDIHFFVFNFIGNFLLQELHQVVLHVSGSRVLALLVQIGGHARLQREHVFCVSGDDIRRRVVRVVPRNRTQHVRTNRERFFPHHIPGGFLGDARVDFLFCRRNRRVALRHGVVGVFALAVAFKQR